MEDSGKETAGAAGEEARGCGEAGWCDGAEAVRREGPGRRMVSEEGCSGVLVIVSGNIPILVYVWVVWVVWRRVVLNGGEMMGDIQRQAGLLQGFPKSCWRPFASGGGELSMCVCIWNDMGAPPQY